MNHYISDPELTRRRCFRSPSLDGRVAFAEGLLPVLPDHRGEYVPGVPGLPG
jgi:hypothetical protein